MKGIRQWVFVTTLVFCLAGKGWGQTYNGMHKYDGTHQNMVTGYMMLGDNFMAFQHFSRGLPTSVTRPRSKFSIAFKKGKCGFPRLFPMPLYIAAGGNEQGNQ